MPPSATTGIALSRDVLRALTRAGTPEAATESVLAAIVGAFGWELGVVWRLDERTGLLVWGGDWAADASLAAIRKLNARLTFAPGVGLPGKVFETLRPDVVDDLAASTDVPRATPLLEAGLTSLIGVPMVARDGPVGVMEFASRTGWRGAEEEFAALGVVAQQLAEYLGRLRVEERLRVSEESAAQIVRAALDCIITMDHRGRIVDINPAAEETFGHPRDAAVGELLSELMIPPHLRAAHRDALDAYLEHGRARILNRRLELVGLRADGSTFPIELTVTRLGDAEPPVFAGFVRDITERHDADEQMRRTAEALQQSLLPPHLPAIPGVQLSGAYRAGAAGWRVGGDFYDVFELSDGRWGLMIGDVCGKGPEAASTTAIVRYAARAAAMRHHAPPAVLAEVNEALLADDRVTGFFTAIYACLETSGEDVVVRLAVGGHPLPLHYTDGEARVVGRPGMILGAFAVAETDEATVTLRPGEALLLYTDGVSEARLGRERFGSERVEALLVELAAADLGDLAPRLEQSLRSLTDEVSDDVAIVVVTPAARDHLTGEPPAPPRPPAAEATPALRPAGGRAAPPRRRAPRR